MNWFSQPYADDRNDTAHHQCVNGSAFENINDKPTDFRGLKKGQICA